MPEKVTLSVEDQLKQEQLKKAQIDRELAEQELILKTAQLEDLRNKNAEAKNKKAIEEQAMKNAVASDAQRQRDEADKQNYCNHEQGGEGLEGLFQGDSNQTTYQKEVTMLGVEFFRCTRCNKEVHKGDPDYDRINRLPHKGLRPAVPVTFKFIDRKTGKEVAVA